MMKQSSCLFGRLRTAATTSLVIGWTALGSTTFAPAQQADPAGQQAAMATADYGQASRCAGWLSPLDMEALRLAAEETLAIAKSRGLAIPDSPPAKPCSDAADRARVTAAAQGFSNTLLLRALSLAAMVDPVGFQLATTYEQKAALEIAAHRLKATATAAGRGSVFDQLVARQRQEAGAIANLACAARQMVRSPKARPCPTLPPEAQANAPAAMAMLASAEAFSQRLATEMAAAAPPPMNRLWEYDPVSSQLLFLGRPATEPAKCVAYTKLLHLTHPRAVSASNADGTVLYAPALQLDGKSPPDWRMLVMLESDEQLLWSVPSGTSSGSLLRIVHHVQLPGWDETKIRDAERDPELRKRWVKEAIRTAQANLLFGESGDDEFDDGEPSLTVYRRCG